ncbi:hypothetical protein F383_17410 [Gossypium arboreum]|uniref:Uncharacterized protein n=1 Tax=Gossypium arboreum TaxID=29729 RepID=A0A0B0NJD2_GOSAR|nr:hypothetical protein F383_17410 [Gossypium arboreum]
MGHHTKSTRLGPPHKGRPHDLINLAESKHERVTQVCSCQAQV